MSLRVTSAEIKRKLARIMMTFSSSLRLCLVVTSCRFLIASRDIFGGKLATISSSEQLKLTETASHSSLVIKHYRAVQTKHSLTRYFQVMKQVDRYTGLTSNLFFGCISSASTCLTVRRRSGHDPTISKFRVKVKVIMKLISVN